MSAIIFLFFSVLSINNPSNAQQEEFFSHDYHLQSAEAIAATLGGFLASKIPSHRDRAVMVIADLINTGKKSHKAHEIIQRLSVNKKTVNIVADIVAERLSGWYEEQGWAKEKSMPMYYPLIHLLSISKSKTAVITLVMALPFVGFDDFFLKSICTHKQVLKILLPKLSTIENKLCCSYPGKDPICDIQAIDFRLSMLRMYRKASKDSDFHFFINDDAMGKFVFDCLTFGNEYKGRIIRAKAVEIACVLIRNGRRELIPTVKKIADSDPSYLYRVKSVALPLLPQYNFNNKFYPVREIAKKELSLK